MTLRAVGTIHRTPDVGFDSGPGTITGTTKNTPATPVRRRVRLHEQSSGRIVRETWSDATTGAYTFPNLRLTRYYVTAFDHTGQYAAVIESDITPTVPT
jgi:chaperone required for assembly of F1-ATPase